MHTSFFQTIVTSERSGQPAAINLVTLILFALSSPAVYGPAIILSKLYANSMMVFLNDRIQFGPDGWQPVSEMATRPLGPIHFAIPPGQADTAQEQIDLEGNSRMSGQTAVEDAPTSKKHSCSA